jgi:hypothetical protein
MDQRSVHFSLLAANVLLETPALTQSAGLTAAHPVLDALSEELPFVAWFLRAHAFLRFGYDPDRVMSEGTDEYGFAPDRQCCVVARIGAEFSAT